MDNTKELLNKIDNLENSIKNLKIQFIQMKRLSDSQTDKNIGKEIVKQDEYHKEGTEIYINGSNPDKAFGNFYAVTQKEVSKHSHENQSQISFGETFYDSGDINNRKAVLKYDFDTKGISIGLHKVIDNTVINKQYDLDSTINPSLFGEILYKSPTNDRVGIRINIPTSAPSNPVKNEMYFNGTNFYIYTGSTWKQINGGITGASGTFTSADGKTITVTDGVVTSIV